MAEKTTVERLVVDIRLLEDSVRNSEYFAAETWAEEVTACLMILETDVTHFEMKMKNYEIMDLDVLSEIDKRNITIKYCRKHANRICALSKGEGCLAQQGMGDYCELQMGSGYISLGNNEDVEIKVSAAVAMDYGRRLQKYEVC